jgi:hypothetical protein
VFTDRQRHSDVMIKLIGAVERGRRREALSSHGSKDFIFFVGFGAVKDKAALAWST